MNEKKWDKGGWVTKAGFSVTTILAAIVFMGSVFTAGFFVGTRYEAGSIAKQTTAVAKEVVKQASKHEAAVEIEATKLQPYYDFKSDRTTFFSDANKQIDKLYKAPKPVAPRPIASVTTDTHSLQEPLHATPQADCDSAGDVMFTADELRLYNLGNKAAEITAAVHPEGVSGALPDGSAGRQGWDQGGDSAQPKVASSDLSRLRQQA